MEIPESHLRVGKHMTAPEIVASTVRDFFAPVVPQIRQRDQPLAYRALKIARPAIIDLSSATRFGNDVGVFLLEVVVSACLFVGMTTFVLFLGRALDAVYVLYGTP